MTASVTFDVVGKIEHALEIARGNAAMQVLVAVLLLDVPANH